MSLNSKRRSHIGNDDALPRRRRRSQSQSSDDDREEDASMTQANDFTSHDASVKRLVRLALSSEVSRKQLRRHDISEKVIGSGGRNFKRVFEDANSRLRDIFGMELKELPKPDKVTLTERRAAQRSGNDRAQDKEGHASSSSKSGIYILTNTLPVKYRTAAIMRPPRLPSAEAEARYSGLVTFVVGVIMLTSGQRISEGKLESYLARTNTLEHFGGEKTERVLKRLEREGYIRKIKEGHGGDDQIDYMLGPRGKIEIGAAGVTGMITTVYDKRGEELVILEKAIEKTLGTNAVPPDAQNSGARTD